MPTLADTNWCRMDGSDSCCRARWSHIDVVTVDDICAERHPAPPHAMYEQIWVEPVGDIIIARIRGEPSADMLRDVQDRVLTLVSDTHRGRVLYDVLEMTAPPVDVPLAQRELDAGLDGIHLRRSIVVPNTKLAYLARLAFGEGEYRVFYNDFASAILWLVESSQRAAADA